MENNKFPKRKNNRLSNYNYNWVSSYFLTICSINHKCIFGEIIKEVIAKDTVSIEKNVAVNAYVQLSDIGEIVKKYIENLNDAYDKIEIENYVIMPDHIHLLVYVHENNENKNGTNAIIPRYVSTLKRFINKEIGSNIFQRSYFDHVVRNDKDFDAIWNYIDSNPVVWKKGFLTRIINNEKFIAQKSQKQFKPL